jgi:putative SOS response-associated peptidase YedK
MCGRFTLRTAASAIAEQFSLLEVPDLQPRFNIAPSQPVPVVRIDPQQAARRQLVFLHWGLVPSWADDPKIGNRMINARAETAADKPSFRTALRRRRCLIVADGFYEWKTVAKRRQPMFIHLRDGRPFAFAGLWEAWEGADHSALESCTILTTAANELVRPIHDRMPVIIAPRDYAQWLDPNVQQAEPIAPLLRPYPAEEMDAYAVSPRVNSPTRDDEACLERVETLDLRS